MTDPIEAVYELLKPKYCQNIITEVIAAYTKAAGVEAVGKQRRYKLSNGTWTEWLNGVRILEKNLPCEERDIFAAPQPPAVCVKPLACPCTLIEQDEECPVGYPSMICGVCEGSGNTTQEKVTALACEMIKIASDVGEPEDPFAAWESIGRLRELARQPPANAIPSGWKLVPVEPTGAIIDVFKAYGFPYDDAKTVFTELLAAAPEPGE